MTAASQYKAKEILFSQPHIIKGTIIEYKQTFPREFRKQYMRNKNSQSMKRKQKFPMQWKLYVVGLPPNVEKSELKVFFQKYGAIEYSNVITKQRTDKPKNNSNLIYLYRVWICCV